MLRLAHFITHPIQYFAPLYRRIADDRRVDLTVLFGSSFGVQASYDHEFRQHIQFDTPLVEGYAHEFLANRGCGVPNGKFMNFNCPDWQAKLQAGRYDALWIHGWGYRAQWQAMRAARRLGIPYFIRAETHRMTASANWLRAAARRTLLGRALRGARACLYVGQRNREFYRSMGVPEAKLFPAHYAIDAHRFARDSQLPDARASARREVEADDRALVIVTVAKAIPRKRIDDVIRAVAMAPAEVQLWVIGDGEERPRLEQLAAELAPGRVRWLGFVNQREMPRRLAGADVLVLASDEEPWGLAVNEAMACGLPAIAAESLGCVPDLIVAGETGYSFPARDVDALAKWITRCHADRAQLCRMGESARKRILTQYDVATTARQIADAMIQCVAMPNVVA